MPFIQAPLAGYTDHPMRILAKQHGCPLTFTGVMLDKIAVHPKAIKLKKFHPHDNEHPVGAQILGEEPETMSQAAAKFLEIGYDLIDLNFACPAPKVLRRLRGGHLMSRPDVIREAFRRTRDKVDGPVFMKIRIGLDSSAESNEKFWQICENAAIDGVDMLAIHGRTVNQKYRGKADWSKIADVKKRFPSLTIFGSGDIFTAETAIARREETGIDGIIVARGAIGNPWIFSELQALWNGRPLPENPPIQEVGRVMLEHFNLICDEYPARKAYPYFRKFAVGYCKRHPDRKKTMLALMAVQTKADVVSIIQSACDL